MSNSIASVNLDRHSVAIRPLRIDHVPDNFMTTRLNHRYIPLRGGGNSREAGVGEMSERRLGVGEASSDDV